MAKPCKPAFNIGDEVHYFDHQKRHQTGRILRIEATWHGYGSNTDPDATILYTVTHPTYANSRHYTCELTPA